MHLFHYKKYHFQNMTITQSFLFLHSSCIILNHHKVIKMLKRFPLVCDGADWRDMVQDIGNLCTNTTFRVISSTTQTQSWTIFWTNIFFDFSSKFPSINNLLKRLNNCDIVREIKSVWSGSMVSKIGLYCTMWKIKYVYVTFCIFLSELSLLSSLQWRIGTVLHYAKRWLVLATVIKLIEDTASENILSYIYIGWEPTVRLAANMA